MKRITAFNGSPKGRASRTQLLVEACHDGAREAGAETETLFLSEYRVLPCRECAECWSKDGECAQDDDGTRLLGKALPADLVLLATPLVMDSMSGLMKLFLERWLPLTETAFRAKRGQGTRTASRRRVPDWVVLSTCSFPEQFHFQGMSAIFRGLSERFGNRIAAEIYRGESDLFGRRDENSHPEATEPYLDLLRKAGAEIVKKGSLESTTAEALEKPLIPLEQYGSEGNATWDRILENRRAD